MKYFLLFLLIPVLAWGQKISQLTEVTTLASDDYFEVSDASAGPASRKVSWANLFKNPVISGTVIIPAPLIFEGATADDFETTLEVADPTADRTITLPNASGTIILSGHTFTGDVTATLDTDGSSALTIADSVTVTGWEIGASTATTPSANDNDTSVATTAFVQGERSIVTKVTNASYTVGTTDPRELYGGVIYVTGAATITIPAVAAGASFTVVTIGAVAVSVDPNASDLIYLDGTALSDGDKITNTSTAGDIAVLTYFDGTGWFASTNSWTDGN